MLEPVYVHTPSATTMAANAGISFQANAYHGRACSRWARKWAIRRVSKPYSARDVSGLIPRAAANSLLSWSSFMACLQNLFQSLTRTKRAHLYVRLAPARQFRCFAHGLFLQPQQRNHQPLVRRKPGHRPLQYFNCVTGADIIPHADLDSVERHILPVAAGLAQKIITGMDG